MAEFMLTQFGLEPRDVFRVDGPVNLVRLMQLPDLVDRPDLKFHPFEPSLPPILEKKIGLFEAISKGDILLHHPYQSFQPVIDMPSARILRARRLVHPSIRAALSQATRL